jgi:8-oxo-dGTP pyrophosphatase MutT (NUDIX family)
MKREIRYQGAIIRDHHILLIKHREQATGRSYWLLPGGGREFGETEEACVQREVREETHLHVSVERLLLDEQDVPLESYYKRLKTYLCSVVNGEAEAGYDPEAESAYRHTISGVRWLDLRDPTEWGNSVTNDLLTFPLLERISVALGYANIGPEETGGDHSGGQPHADSGGDA